MKKPSRDRQRPLRVVVSAEERAAIAQRAAAAGLSISAYLRTAGLGHEPKSAFDPDAILALIKTHADQGRLKDLLNQWLATKPGDGAPTTPVRMLLQQIEQLQQQLKAVVTRL